MLYRSTDCLSRCGAPVEYLAHSASFQLTVNNAPSKPGIKHLNPVENIWQFMRDNWLSNRVFTSYDKIVEPLLRGLEQTRRSAVAHHDHRPPQMGPWVMINAGLYNVALGR